MVCVSLCGEATEPHPTDYRRYVSSLTINRSEDFTEFTLTLSDGLILRGGMDDCEESDIARVEALLHHNKELFLKGWSNGQVYLDGIPFHFTRWYPTENFCYQLPQIVSIETISSSEEASLDRRCYNPDATLRLSDGSCWEVSTDPGFRHWKQGDRLLVCHRTNELWMIISNVDYWNDTIHYAEQKFVD